MSAPMSEQGKKLWSCKVGEVDREELDRAVENHPRGNGGGDAIMRAAVESAYVALIGYPPRFTFSGWGDELTESERAVVEDREPEYVRTGWLEEQLHELRIELRGGDKLPEWDELTWLAMMTVKLGQLAFLWHPEGRTADPSVETELLKGIAAVVLDAIESLGPQWAAREGV